MNNCSEQTSVPSFETEIQQEADDRIVEVILRLMDKLEQISSCDSQELLRIYVALKRTKHRFKKDFNRDWILPKISWEEFNLKLEEFNVKISQARRNYYAAKSIQPGK